MKTWLLTGPGRVEVVEAPEPSPATGEVLVRVGLLGLCGTDLGLYDGTSNYVRDGYKRYPFVPGHEWTGTVVEVGSGVDASWVGRRVAGHNFRPCGTCATCRAGRITQCPHRSEIGVLGEELGAARELIAVPLETVELLPDGMSDVAAAMLEPTAAAMHAVSRIKADGEDAVVLGAGTLGIAAAQILRAGGSAVTVVEPASAARALATEFDLPVVPSAGDLPPAAAPIVIEASGAEPAFAAAIRLCGSGGRIAQLGTPHGPAAGVPVADLIIREITIHGVLSGVGHWRGLIDLISRGHVDLDPLLESVHPLTDASSAFARLADRNRRRPKVLIHFDESLSIPHQEVPAT